MCNACDLKAQAERLEALNGERPRRYPPAHTGSWHDEPPKAPGKYRWRLDRKWEDIERQIDGDGKTYSHRFAQLVDARRVGGQWFY